MKKILLKYGIIFTFTMVSGALLMNVSQRVQRIEGEIKRYDRLILNEEEAIRVLKADWAYLNDPARLENLAVKNLELISPDSSMLTSSMDIIPEENPPNGSLEESIFVPQKSPIHRDISYTPLSSHEGDGQ